MKTLYIDCGMGAAGDMLMAALYELVEDKAGCLDKLNAIGIPEVNYEVNLVSKCGINGTYMKVSLAGEVEESHDCDLEHTHHHDDDHHNHEHHHHHHDHDHHNNHEHEHEHEHHHHDHEHTHMHYSLSDVDTIIDSLNTSIEIKNSAKEIYRIIAKAESNVHGVEVTAIHFHEVGSLDAIADVVGVCLLMNELGNPRVIASPVNLGSGQVKCAHGILPVPAPATANILIGIPCYSSDIKGELCTPTGAALLKYFSKEFGNMPVMSVERIGYGAGKKDFVKANLVRAMLGKESNGNEASVVELSCNVDDMTGEEMGLAMDILFKAGALDVYTTPIYMKKNRPGIKLSVLVRSNEVDKFIQLIFKNTSTIGIRESSFKRYTLERNEKIVDTEAGQIRIKVSSGYGIKKEKPEYEDIVSIAQEKGLSYREVISMI